MPHLVKRLKYATNDTLVQARRVLDDDLRALGASAAKAHVWQGGGVRYVVQKLPIPPPSLLTNETCSDVVWDTSRGGDKNKAVWSVVVMANMAKVRRVASVYYFVIIHSSTTLYMIDFNIMSLTFISPSIK